MFTCITRYLNNSILEQNGFESPFLKFVVRVSYLFVIISAAIAAYLNFDLHNNIFAWSLLSQGAITLFFLIRSYYTKLYKKDLFVAFVLLFIYTYIQSILFWPFDKAYVLNFILLPIATLLVFDKVIATIVAFFSVIAIASVPWVQPYFSAWSLNTSPLIDQYIEIYSINVLACLILMLLYAWYSHLEQVMIAFRNKQRQLEDTQEKLIELQHVRNRFFASMSHEIRTPMNAIHGISQLLDLKDQSEQQKNEYLGILRQSSKHLLNLINDILDLSKIEEGRLNFQSSAFSPESLLQECSAMIRSLQKKEVAFDCVLRTPLPPYIYTDPIRLKQVIINLLNNAMTYTLQGQVTLFCSNELETTPDKLPCLMIEVRDTGIGIPSHLHQKIFEGYVQVDSTKMITQSGTGLGLSISKKIIEYIQGQIWLQSTPNKGSTFFIRWPYRIPPKQEGEQKPFASELGSPVFSLSHVSAKVLIVDDNETNVLILRKLLERKLSDCQFVHMPTGLEALQYLDRYPDVQLILMDMSMPEMDGLECSRRIRSLPHVQTSLIPIIAVTANAFPEDEKACYESGMNDFVAKPIDIETLVDKIEYWLSRELPSPPQSK